MSEAPDKPAILAAPESASGFRHWMARNAWRLLLLFAGVLLPLAGFVALADEVHEPTRVIEARSRDWLASDGIRRALDSLDERSRRIVEARWLQVNDNGSGGLTLHDLAAEYGVSAERIRQIEVAAMKKMKKALAEYA